MSIYINDEQQCIRCKEILDISYYQDEKLKTLFKICKFCRFKRMLTLTIKDKEKYDNEEHILTTLNYTICHYKYRKYVSRFEKFGHAILKSMIKKHEIMYLYHCNLFLIPLTNNKISYIQNKKGHLQFLINEDKKAVCDICYSNKTKFLNCYRCKKEFCFDCYKKSKLYSCMFCRYTLDDHLTTKINGVYDNLLNRDNIYMPIIDEQFLDTYEQYVVHSDND